MRTLSNFIYGTLAFSLALLSLNIAPALADDAAKPPVQIGMVAGKSIDALTAFVKLTGMDLPPNVSADGIEQQFPFIGKGGVVTDMPIGMAFCGSADMKSPDQGIVFIIPVKPTAATLDSLKTQGGTAVADHPDTILVGGAGIRRTADYVLFSPTPAAVNAVNIGAIGDAVKAGDALVRMSIDLKAVRQNLPDQYKQMKDMVTSGAGGAERAMAVAPMVKSLDTLDRFEASLDNGEKGIRLAFSAAPSALPKIAAANRPGMPPGVLARGDLGASIFDAYPASKDMFASLSKSAQDDPAGNKGKPFSDDQKKQIDSIMTQLGVLWTEPAAMSLGVEAIAGEPVIYIVQHWGKPMDVPAQMQQIAGKFNAIQKETDPNNTVELQTYQSEGVRVLRLVAMDSGKAKGCLDVAQKGDDVYITICPNAYRYVHHLMAAKDEGPIATVYSAWIDLGKLSIALSDGPNAPLASMPADTRKQLAELLKDQKIGIASSGDGDLATVELTLGKGLVQNAPKLAALFGLSSVPAAPAPETTPKPQ